MRLGGKGGVLPGIYVTEAELRESIGFGKWKRDEQSKKLGSIMQRMLEGMWICTYLNKYAVLAGKHARCHSSPLSPES